MTRVYASTGDSFPGLLTAVLEPVGYFTASLTGALTFGGLVYVAITARPAMSGVIDESAFRTHLVIEKAAAAWAIVATTMVAVQAASDAGLPVLRLVGSAKITDAVASSEMARAWVVVAIKSIVVAVRHTTVLALDHAGGTTAARIDRDRVGAGVR